jgi:hypothetical protein
MADPPLFNFQAMLADQGVPFYAGLPPPASNITDSPLQAWTDNISGSDSENAMMTGQQDEDYEVSTVLSMNMSMGDYRAFDLANASLLANFSIAKSVWERTFSPNLELDNGKFLSCEWQISPSMAFELVGEAFCFMNNKKARVCAPAQHLPPSLNIAAQIEAFTGQKGETPLVTTQVRRSARANKYDGFKIHLISDTKIAKSKVKARVVPAVKKTLKKKKSGGENIAQMAGEHNIPPPTPIATLQSIGVNLCGVPPEDVSPMKLLALPQEEETSPMKLLAQPLEEEVSEGF